MKCVFPGRGIRAFGKAVFCLAKLGDELYLEGKKDGLALKAVNNARSAYACFLFNKSFFLSYNDGRITSRDAAGEDEGEGTGNVIKCKISNKSFLSIFKSLSTLERTVEHCKMKLDEEACKLIFVFHCRHGIVKTHSLGYQETNVIQAVFDKELCGNLLKISAKVLSDVMSNFPNSLDEVTLRAESAGIRIRNFVDEHDMEDMRVSLTEVSLALTEFDNYQVRDGLSLTFCLKELRALLFFTDAINHSLTLRFEEAGRPIIISIEDDKDYRVDVVLATLLDDAGTPQPMENTTAATQAASSSSSTAIHSSTQNTRHVSCTQRTALADHPRARAASTAAFIDEDQEVCGGGDGPEGNTEDREPYSSDRGCKRKTTRLAQGGRAPRRSKAADVVPQFPSGSQFRHATLSSNRGTDQLLMITSKSARRTQIGSVPAVPGNFDGSGAATPCDSGLREHSTVATSHSLGGLSRLSREEEEEEMMDALFGGENMDGVVEQGGSMFGFDAEQQQQQQGSGQQLQGGEKQGSGRQLQGGGQQLQGGEQQGGGRQLQGGEQQGSGRQLQGGGQQLQGGEQQGGGRQLQGGEQQGSGRQLQGSGQQQIHLSLSHGECGDAATSFPYLDNKASASSSTLQGTAVPLHSSSRVRDGVELGVSSQPDAGDTSKDSLLDDESFLPNTPPTKKFKPMSELFGMDVFSNAADDSEILAPDSDSDAD